MKLCLRFKKLRSTCSGNILPVWQTLPLAGWEQRELSCGWGRKKSKNGWRYQYFTCFRGNWPTDLWEVQLCHLGPRMIIVEPPCEGWFKYIDHSLHFGSCCLLCFCHKFGLKLASHYKPLKKWSIVRWNVLTMFGELKVNLSSIKKLNYSLLNCAKYVRRTNTVKVRPIKHMFNMAK